MKIFISKEQLYLQYENQHQHLLRCQKKIIRNELTQFNNELSQILIIASKFEIWFYKSVPFLFLSPFNYSIFESTEDMILSHGTNEISAKNLTNFKIQTPGNKENTINLKDDDEDLNPPDDGESEFRSRTRAKPINPKQRVAELIGVELWKKNLTPQLFQQYKQANFKVNLQKLSTQKEEKLNFIDLNHIELEDDEQIEYFLQQLTLGNPDLKISNILNVNVEKKIRLKIKKYIRSSIKEDQLRIIELNIEEECQGLCQSIQRIEIRLI